MTTAIIITICALLLLAYVFDLTSSKTKVPSVILLLLLGFGMRQVSMFIDVKLPNLTPLLPILGTIGLILIVLEGSLELEFNKSKTSLIKKSFVASLIPMLLMAFTLSFLFHYFGDASYKDSLTNAIPLCIISSAIAIPSVKTLTPFNKEFVIYESSLSDIIGVTAVSFIATIGLALLLNKINHHIKFAPIILLIILIYEVSKIYNLPGLVFILFFGLFLGNLDELRKFKWVEKFKPDEFEKEIQKFKELTTEGAFLVRALFFLLFGFLIQANEIINTDTLIWAAGIVIGIFIFRAIQLKLSKLPLSPLLFIAPRGLITILLFLAIEPEHLIPLVNKSLIIQVIILTALVMMFGLMTNKVVEPIEENK
jgi:cell volume regulation protein A